MTPSRPGGMSRVGTRTETSRLAGASVSWRGIPAPTPGWFSGDTQVSGFLLMEGHATPDTPRIPHNRHCPSFSSSSSPHHWFLAGRRLVRQGGSPARETSSGGVAWGGPYRHGSSEAGKPELRTDVVVGGMGSSPEQAPTDRHRAGCLKTEVMYGPPVSPGSLRIMELRAKAEKGGGRVSPPRPPGPRRAGRTFRGSGVIGRCHPSGGLVGGRP